MEAKTVQVSCYLERNLYEKMQSIVEADDRSMNYMVLKAVSEFVAKPENVAKWSTNRGENVGQVDIETAIAAAVKRGPMPRAAAKHK